jgi:hypothetical protein
MKMKIISLLVLSSLYLQAEQPWSHVYKRILTKKEQQQYANKYRFIYKEKDVMPFTQLVLTWNALRPKKGTFTFRVRVRDYDTQKWDTLHKAALWGKEQKSFFSRGVTSAFHYSRLEMEKGKKADAFEVEVEGDDATLNLLKALFITVSNQDEFQSEPQDERGNGLKSCKVKKAAKKSQKIINHPRANALCSPTSVSMLVQTLQRRHVDPLLTAQYVYDPALDVFGNWPFNMAHAFELGNGNLFFYVMRPSSFKEIYERLRRNVPVAVSIRGPIKGGYTPYKNGHLMVVVGWDAANNKVLCFDPASDDLDGVKKDYDIDDFIAAWERSRRLTYMPEILSSGGRHL